ncbi:3-phosphoshikimate 1-carboxyvinyltransferase [Thiorhodospira sibirica]|uniref:3-phosphoshikimate 1-carboxyvinyltransferase n=1 Tax=Thiorhodospira sibirica TaxID=154347 RepID=UPI00022C5E5F|nr:3-phosphoshikimate 1-carboxyvinyltransferase [Thiorhodospira sibirica]
MTVTHYQAPLSFVAEPGGVLQGRIRVTGDKSISHRAIMLGAIAQGCTEISGFLEGEDCLATLQAFRAMGVPIEGPVDGRVRVHGVGLRGLQAPAQPLDMGNSGTSMRLLTGLLAGHGLAAVLVGDSSLMRRPMRRVTDPLARMGAQIATADNGNPPLNIHAGHALQGIEYVMPMASAQVKSSILLAGLYAQGTTCVTEPAPTRDHTERMLQGFGYPLRREGPKVCLEGGHALQATAIDVPGDISSAAFFMVGASIAKGSELLLEHVGINPTRTGVIDILRLMGADIELLNVREAGGEPVADIRVRSAPLHGVDIPEALVPLAIDEFPAIFIAAACAHGKTVLTGARELRVKESDRIQVMADGLQTCGVAAQPTEDGMVITGGPLQGGEIHSHGDHRIAMAFAMAALAAQGRLLIHDCANVNTSFPGFAELARHTGVRLLTREGA